MIISKDNRNIDEGQHIKIYRNFRKRCWSVTACDGFYSGKVVGWAESIMLSDCEFVVREKSHWIEGRVIRHHCGDGLSSEDVRKVVYSSHDPKSYVWEDSKRSVIECVLAFFGSNGCIYATVWG